MAALSSEKILKEKNTSDANSISSLALTHKALSDVCCLSEFKSLERLDLGFNCLASLEGLKLCVNLKWLSVVQNKLHCLKGVEGLTKLTLLNAGKNKLKSMDEVKYLSSLRALILNDNEIGSICKLDQMKELNTLVLSRNPISSLGESLTKVKSITKLSLSNCQLQTIDSTLKSCVELKELRLAHNEIMTIPSEIFHLTKLQNLDLGNNLITKWSYLKGLASLSSLKNLNLQGNPVAGKENFIKKVKNLLPNLNVFNAKPTDKILEKVVNDSMDKMPDKSPVQDEMKSSHESRNKTSRIAHPVAVNEIVNTHHKGTENAALKNKKRRQLDEKDEKLIKTSKVDKLIMIDEPETPFIDLFATNTTEIRTVIGGKKFDQVKVDSTMKHKKSRKLTKRDNLSELGVSESSFTDPPAVPEIPVEVSFKRLNNDQIFRDYDRGSDVISMTIYKRNKKHVQVDPVALSQPDIGLGGASSWE